MRRSNRLAENLKDPEGEGEGVVKERGEGSKVDERKRQRLTDNQCAIPEAKSPVVRTPRPTPHPLYIDHIVDHVFNYIFPGSQEVDYNLKELCNFRLVSQVWNEAGLRLLKTHVWIGLGEMVRQAEHYHVGGVRETELNIEKELLPRSVPIVRTLQVERISEFADVMRKSPNIPFVMFSFRETLFFKNNTDAIVHLLQICGPTMKQLLVSMESAYFCTSSHLPDFDLKNLEQLTLVMKVSDIKYQRKSVIEVYGHPMERNNGGNFLRSLCKASIQLKRLDVRRITHTPFKQDTFGLQDLFLSTTITNLTVDVMRGNRDTFNLLLHQDLNLNTLKLSIDNLCCEGVNQCLKRHSASLKTFHFSIGKGLNFSKSFELVEFPTMPNVEQLSLLVNRDRITPFSFQNVFPKVSSLTLCNNIFDFMEEGIPSKTVKFVRLLGAPITCDVRIKIAKCFPELETLMMFSEHDVLSKEYLVSMFSRLKKLRILIYQVSNSDSNVSYATFNMPNGLHMTKSRPTTCIVKMEADYAEIERKLFFYWSTSILPQDICFAARKFTKNSR